MTINGPHNHNQQSSRLQEYDYSQSGAYFITVCTQAHIGFFGKIAKGVLSPNRCNEIVRSCWNEIPQHFPDVRSAPFIVTPNHLHGIIIISKRTTPITHQVETRHAVSLHTVESVLSLIGRGWPV